MEPGFKNVLDVVGVGGDGVLEEVDVDGFGGGVSEEMSVPITKIVEGFGPA